MDEEVKYMNKLSTGYSSIGHLKGSRVGPADRHIDDAQTKRFTEEGPKDRNCVWFVEEKMDGSNCSVMRINGEIRTLTRTGYDCTKSNYEQHKMFDRWVTANKDKFEKLLPNEQDRCVGEWMALAHGTVYKDLASPYMIFDLFITNHGKYLFKGEHGKLHAGPDPQRFPVLLRRKLVNDAGLTNVPLVYQQTAPISIHEALSLVDDNAEGVVYKIEIKNKNCDYSSPYMIGKVVKQDKEDGKYLKEGLEIWNWTDIVS